MNYTNLSFNPIISSLTISFVLGYILGTSTNLNLDSLKNKLIELIRYFKAPTSLHKLDKNTHLLKYHHKGQEYKLHLKINNQPPKFMSIVNENGDDIQDKLIPFIGPNHDFHLEQIELTPLSLGVKSLTFSTWDGEDYNFNGDEKITF